MNSKRNNRLVGQINGMVTVLLLMIGILASFLMKGLIDHIGVGYINEDVRTKATIISHSIRMTERLDQQLEQQYDEKLYYAAKAISGELKGRDINSITSEELVALRTKWGVEEITLMTREPDGGFVFSQSTNPKEIGVKTGSDWGFWQTAFTQLWERKPLDVPSGRVFSSDCWVGPLADSEALKDNQLYKYAYFYNGETEFIVAPFVKATDLKNDHHTVSLMNKMLHNPHIKDISVINANSFLNSTPDIYDAMTDLPILYGTNRYAMEQDKAVVQSLLHNQDAEMQFITFLKKELQNGEQQELEFQKYYVKAPSTSSSDARIIMMVMDLSEYDALKTKMYMITFLVSALTILLILMFIQWITRRQLKPIEAIIHHIEQVTRGDFSNRLSISDNNEFEWLGQRLNDMTHKMGAMIEQINQQANETVSFTQSAYHEELKKLLTSVKSIRHDFHNHMSVIKGLMQIGKPDRAMDYLNDITKEVNRIAESLDIKNPELSVFFHSKFLIAENNNVRLHYEIESDTFDSIPSIDQIKMYGNLIDNALDELLKLPFEERVMHITLRRKEQAYYFRVDNTGAEISPEHAARLFELGFSTKPINKDETRPRGSGLSIVKQTLEKYDGKIHVFRDDQMTCFELIIPFSP